MSTKINTDEIRSRLLLSGNYDTPNIIHNWQQLSALTEHLLNEIDRLNKVKPGAPHNKKKEDDK